MTDDWNDPVEDNRLRTMKRGYQPHSGSPAAGPGNPPNQGSGGKRDRLEPLTSGSGVMPANIAYVGERPKTDLEIMGERCLQIVKAHANDETASLRLIGELAWALGVNADFQLIPIAKSVLDSGR
jgi:hypothetical protein